MYFCVVAWVAVVPIYSSPVGGIPGPKIEIEVRDFSGLLKHNRYCDRFLKH